jgi:hypothetical protein
MFFDTNTFYDIFRFSNSCGIDESETNSANDQFIFGVTRCSCNFETMARSSLSKAFNRVRFPHLVHHNSYWNSVLITFPTANRVNQTFQYKLNYSTIREIEFYQQIQHLLRQSLIRVLSAKQNSVLLLFGNFITKTTTHLLHRNLWLASLSDEIKSATASACDKSSFPFKNARKVNRHQPCGNLSK